MKRTQLPKETVEGILDNYVNKGFGLIKSGKEFGVGTRVVRRVLLENNIHIRSFNEAASISGVNRRIHDVNDNYFSEENHNMAYLLGFLASDGTIRKNDNSVKIGLSSVDRDFLLTIKKEIGYQGELTDYITSNGFSVSELRFTSKQIKADLAKYNIIPNKTFIYTFPKNLKREYWIDFIRGYFDGDGSVFISHEHHWRNQTLTNVIHWRFIGTLDMLENIKKQINIPIGKISRKKDSCKNTYELAYKRTKWSKTFYNYLYKNSTIYLDRKKQVFDLFFKNDAQRL